MRKLITSGNSYKSEINELSIKNYENLMEFEEIVFTSAKDGSGLGILIKDDLQTKAGICLSNKKAIRALKKFINSIPC